MKFRSLFNYGTSGSSPTGSRFRKKYIRAADGIDIIEDGSEDVYDSIQKAGIGITVEDLLRRAAVGDTTAIGEPIDSFADLSNMPTDMLSAHQLLLESESKFDKLPASLKSKFNNSFSDFLAAVYDGTAAQVYTDMITPKNEEVIENA